MKLLTKIIAVLFVSALLFSCKTKYVEIPIEKIKTEIEYRDKVKRDSIYTRDSIIIHSKGDTIWMEKYKTLYKEKLRIDSVEVEKIVLQDKPVIVEKSKPYYPKWIVILAIFGIVAIGYRVYKIIKPFIGKF
ncbi:hypothetical protein [Dysgonomonas massiliensis]|uniref:hypothetical protein n=1 Tax=Dysgonomonas massiliensis TaxID=2040292 RepID=UPI000C7686B2|nr:hypothetical protein [Dysgonomonas massiliensis]